MHESYTSSLSDRQRAALHARRAARRKARLRAQRRRRLRQTLLVIPFLILIIVGIAVFLRQPKNEPLPVERPVQQPLAVAPEPIPEAEPVLPYHPECSSETISIGETISSANAVLLDLQRDVVLAEKDMNTIVSPASMTKILTLIVAVEHIQNFDDTVTITQQIADYCYSNDCSVVGYAVGDTPTVRDLLYGTILPSGADAALGLADYVAGSHEAFVDLMNEKLEELGLAETTHFTNCVGIYHPDHACTVYDMSVILKAAMENELCRNILSLHQYTTAPTIEHPDGIPLSNFFLRRIEDHDTQQPVRAVGAKTGYVADAGCCAASWGADSLGNEYICVTAHGSSSWGVIYDHVALYQLCSNAE